jgi:uncharacterized protein YecE (DUF72 family)
MVDVDVAAPGRLRVGCSGWSYADWRGRFYDAGTPARSFFAAYAEQFDTVELNNTFYRLPPVSTVEHWAAQAPPGFVYAVKLGGYCTHRKKLADPEQWLPNHLDRTARLGDHLGPNLVQLPPRWNRDVGRLEAFLALAPRDQRWAVEVRDPSWLHDDVFACLERHGAALCINDLVDDHPWVRTARWSYLRFHGPHATTRPYHGRYGSERLHRIAERIGPWLDEGDVYVYFDNDQAGAAPVDALEMREAAGRVSFPS